MAVVQPELRHHKSVEQAAAIPYFQPLHQRVAEQAARAARAVQTEQEQTVALAAAQAEKEMECRCNQRERAIALLLVRHKGQMAAQQRLALHLMEVVAVVAAHQQPVVMRQAQILDQAETEPHPQFLAHP